MENKINFNVFKEMADNLPKTKNVNFGFGDLQFNIQVKQYVPVSDKLTFAVQIASACVSTDEETGFKKEDKMLKQIFFNIYLIEYYTNIELNEQDDVNINYNTFQIIGLFDVIKSEIPENELKFLNEAVENAINAIVDVADHVNSIGYVLKSLLMSIDSDLVDSVKALKDFNLIKGAEQLPTIEEVSRGNRQTRRSTNKKNKSE